MDESTEGVSDILGNMHETRKSWYYVYKNGSN